MFALLLLLAVLLANAIIAGWAFLAFCRWFMRRYVLPDSVSGADERRFYRSIKSAADPFFEWLAPGGLDPAETDGQLDSLAVISGNRPLPRTRKHPLGDYRLDSPLVQRAVSFLKSQLVVENDTPSNRMTLQRHFQGWAREKGLRIHQIRHFTPVVVTAFFIKTEVEKDIELLRQSKAWKENQAPWEPPKPSRIVRALCWVLRLGRNGRGVRPPSVV
jgi:hypothetical protein